MILLIINLNDLLVNIIISLITSFFASLSLIYFLLIRYSPKIKISDFICKKNDEYKFKIVNLSKYPCFDVRLELKKFKNVQSNNGNLNKQFININLSTNYLLAISKFKKDVTYADNCCLVKSTEDLIKYCTNSEQQIILTISLKHGLSGLNKTFKKIYCLSDIKENKQFAFGQVIEMID